MQGSAPGGAGSSCLSRATACAFVLLSLYFALLPLLFRVLVHRALSAESTAEKQENVNASQSNSGTVMVCVCSPKCTCGRECSKQHLQPLWHPPLEVGRKGIHTAAACRVCPCSRWREMFSAQADQLGSIVHASSTRNSVTPSHRPGSSICQHHEWLLQVALDDVDGQGGGELEVSASDLNIMRLSERAVLPTRGTPGAAGLDLSAAESVVIDPWSRKLVRTDLAISTPPGTYARVAPRSGMSLKNSIDIAAGVIDHDYRGKSCKAFCYPWHGEHQEDHAQTLSRQPFKIFHTGSCHIYKHVNINCVSK